MEKLSVVAAPIGNLEDVTLRALRVLKEADVIACEDTRVTKKLLAHFKISKPLLSFRGASKEYARVLRVIEEGKRVVFASDAGTPGISDPGLELVSRVRETFPGLKIETIPGPSALTAALAISGLRAASFTFYGFLPLKKGREKLFAEMAGSPRASVFFESPHRILKALHSLEKNILSSRRVGIFRELTKVHEEARIGTVKELALFLEAQPEKQRGEYTIVIEGER